MGMMTSLRRLTKTRPVLGIIFVIVLAIGLIGSYAIFAMPQVPNVNQYQAGQNTNPSKQEKEIQEAVQEQISKLQGDISSLKKEVKAKPDAVDKVLELAQNQYYLGSLYHFSNDHKKAAEFFEASISSYQKVLELNPEEKGINLRLAEIAMYIGNNKMAEENFKAAIKADPDDNNARLTYGIYLSSLKGDYKGAIKQWEEIMKYNPDKNMAEQVQAMIKQAKEVMGETHKGNQK